MNLYRKRRTGLIKMLFGTSLQLSPEIGLVTVLSTTLILVSYYRQLLGGRHWEHIVLFLVVPLAVIVVLPDNHPGDYGFQIGDFRLGILLTVLGIAIMTPILWLITKQSPEMQSYYQQSFSGVVWRTGVEMVGWEFLFRGWILFSYGKRFGPDAIWLQAVPFAVAHLTKPELESLSTILGGFAFGWIAWKTKSFLYPFLIHWFITCWVIFLV